MKHVQNIFISFALVALIASCAPTMQPPLKALDTSNSPNAGEKYVPKVDNFQVILDSSLSMNENGQNYFLVARDLVQRINQGIPADLNFNGGLRSLGHSSYQSKNSTDLLYGMSDYNKASFHDGLGKIKYVGGETPMAAALQAAAGDFKSAAGSSALIVVSDGLDMNDAPAAAKELKSMLGDNLCIYTIAIGNERNGSGQDVMNEIAEAGQCGFATADAMLADDASMANFINQVFITKAAPKPAPKPVVMAPKDSDGDGVIDAQDKCPGTLKGAPVDKVGCPLDSDDDGVFDYMDKCPGTPKGAPVDKVGCPLDSDGDGVFDYMDKCPGTPQGVSIDATGCPTKLTLRIEFDNDSNAVKAKYVDEIARAAQCINEYPGNQVVVYGHTDSRGAAEYNQGLSERRAAAVVMSLVNQFDIKASRLVTRGFGEDQPIADNATKEGRALNRRVEIGCGATE